MSKVDRTIDETHTRCRRVSGVRGDKSQDIRIKSAQIETIIFPLVLLLSAVSATQDDVCAVAVDSGRSQGTYDYQTRVKKPMCY